MLNCTVPRFVLNEAIRPCASRTTSDTSLTGANNKPAVGFLGPIVDLLHGGFKIDGVIDGVRHIPGVSC